MVPMGHDEVRPLCGKQSAFGQQILDFLDNGSERFTCSHRSPSPRVAFHTVFRLALNRVREVRIQTAAYPVNGLRRSATTSHLTSNQWWNRIRELRYRPAAFSRCRTPVASLSTQSSGRKPPEAYAPVPQHEQNQNRG